MISSFTEEIKHKIRLRHTYFLFVLTYQFIECFLFLCLLQSAIFAPFYLDVIYLTMNVKRISINIFILFTEGEAFSTNSSVYSRDGLLIT
jgi:hypothetical protein